ncbi:hypothetical protein GmHk_18G052439 [Glycine max]|nr:hypothetical protein GmHk_18G052439 [Glycine max]
MVKTRFLAAFRVGKVGIHYPNYFPIFLFPHTKKTYFFSLHVSLQNIIETVEAILPNYVLFYYNGKTHFVRVQKYGNRYFFADGLKEFRRTYNIKDGVIIRLFAPDKNTSFELDVMGPIHGQSTRRSVVTTRRHVFTTDVTQDMVQHNLPLLLQIFCLAKKKNISIHRGYGRRNQWQITIHDGLPSLAKPWFQHLSKNNLMPGNEVVFFFKFDEHAWEALFRKKVIWDDTLSS